MFERDVIVFMSYKVWYQCVPRCDKLTTIYNEHCGIWVDEQKRDRCELNTVSTESDL